MRASRRKRYIVITADKGLAGAYNHNVLKELRKRKCDERTTDNKIVCHRRSRTGITLSTRGVHIDGQFHSHSLQITHQSTEPEI